MASLTGRRKKTKKPALLNAGVRAGITILDLIFRSINTSGTLPTSQSVTAVLSYPTLFLWPRHIFQRYAHQEFLCSAGCFQLIDSFLEAAGHNSNATLIHLCRTHLKNVTFYFGRMGKIILHPVKPRIQHHGESKIRITGRIRATNLSSGRQAACCRDTNECRTVRCRPGTVHRSLIPRNQALVRVDQWIGYCSESAGIFQCAGNIGIGNLGELQRIGLIKKCIGAIQIKERLVGMHTRTIDTKNWFWHKGRMQAIFGGD